LLWALSDCSYGGRYPKTAAHFRGDMHYAAENAAPPRPDVNEHAACFAAVAETEKKNAL
jgi:hypothetical protein